MSTIYQILGTFKNKNICSNNFRVGHWKNAFCKGICLEFNANILNNFMCVMDLFILLLRSKNSL